MIHCHDDDLQVFLLDQVAFLTHAYAHTKDWRASVLADSEKALTWSNELFYVSQPFRRPTSEQMAKKKKKKKNAKRTHDEALADADNELIPKLSRAVDFCKAHLSLPDDPSLTQAEHSFDGIPLAEIATQHVDRLPPIREILLTDYFLRAAKLGVQANVLYTHDRNHASIVDTAVGGRVLLPARSRFLWADTKHVALLARASVSGEQTKYSFIVLDPPWSNKSVRRKGTYRWSDFDDIRNLPVENLIDRTRPSLVCCWSTNCDRVEDFVKKELFKKWNCQYLATWYWLKVTRAGEPVLDLSSTDKKPYETLILACTDSDDDRFSALKDTTKIICSVPALIHSSKPALHVLFQRLIHLPNDETDRCLEIYARNLLPNFTSVGNEVLKHQSIELFQERPV